MLWERLYTILIWLDSGKLRQTTTVPTQCEIFLSPERGIFGIQLTTSLEISALKFDCTIRCLTFLWSKQILCKRSGTKIMSYNIIGPLPKKSVEPINKVEKSSGNLDDIEETVVMIRQKGLDNKKEEDNTRKYQFQGQSAR